MSDKLISNAAVPMLSSPSQPIEIAHDDFVAGQSDGSIAIVDVREPHEFAAGHIPGAINQPLSSFEPDELPSGKPIVLVCQVGGRSAKALQQARAAGVGNISHYAPGTGGWRARGGVVVAGSE
jgi:rhodanese-related sulfurtransferase